jgi:SulP family sulfate permease
MKNKVIENWKSGLTVALVSIPLSISLAMASGSTPTAGIITAIAAGIIGALFGGSHFNIIGPTGALTGVIASFALTYGMGLLPFMAILTGVIIIIAYFVKVEKYLVFVPSSVIHGFTLAIAIILIFNQINYAFGLDHIPQKANVIDICKQLYFHYKEFNFITFGSFLVYFGFLWILRKKKFRIPGAILLAPLAILVGYLSSINYIPFTFYKLGDKFPNVELILSYPQNFLFNRKVFGTALTISFIAIVETMLSAKIADTMTKTKHDPRKEILSLGIANIVSGLFGGLPATAALARTSLNIKSGAKNRTSGIISGIFISIIALFFLSQFRYIPMAAIAAILVDTAMKMIDSKHFKKFKKYDKRSLVISLVVALTTIAEDPIVGIGLGVTISFLLLVEKISHGHFELSVNTNSGVVRTISGDKMQPLKEDGSILLYSFRGNLLYLNSEAHLHRFESDTFDHYQTIIFRLREVYMMDLDGVEALDDMIKTITKKGKKVMIVSVAPDLLQFLRRTSHEFIFLENHGLVFDKTTYALEHLGINKS